MLNQVYSSFIAFTCFLNCVIDCILASSFMEFWLSIVSPCASFFVESLGVSPLGFRVLPVPGASSWFWFPGVLCSVLGSRCWFQVWVPEAGSQEFLDPRSPVPGLGF